MPQFADFACQCIRRAALVCVSVGVLSAFAAPAVAQSSDESNIYATDVQRASRAIARAEERRLDAAGRLATIVGIEEAGKRADRLSAVAARRSAAASRAVRRAEERANAIRDERKAAHAAVTDAASKHSSAVAAWRERRADWIAAASAILALALASIAAVAIAVRRTVQGIDSDRLANVVGVVAGTGVATYLCGLLGALLWADAWVFSWWLVGAAACGVLTGAAAPALGWSRPALARPYARLGHAAIPTAAVALAVALAPAVATASLEGPARAPASAAIEQLALDYRTDAPLPPDAQALSDRADRLKARAARAEGHASSARDKWAALVTARNRAHNDLDAATRSIAYWSGRRESVQKDYDRYQRIVDVSDEEEPPEFEPSEYEVPEYEVPDFEPLPVEPLEDNTEPTYPTTEDFGSGSGRIGLCKDGTISDSIGRPGACSHHGGVAG